VKGKARASIQVLLFTKQPFVAAGVSAVLGGRRDLELCGTCDSLSAAVERLRSGRVDIVLVHLTSRTSLAELGQLWSSGTRARVVLWGDAIEGEFAFQAMLLGVRAILPAHTSIDSLLTSLVNVHRGVLCFDKEMVDRVLLQHRVTLTRREGQVVALVAKGYKNKAIGGALGITEGTVKLYLYKLFKKLGVNDRLDLALYGLKNLFSGQAEIEDGGEPFIPRTLAPTLRVN
jgi:two-component system nitrate/nitrite response regulator NarP